MQTIEKSPRAMKHTSPTDWNAASVRKFITPGLMPRKDTHPIHKLFAYPAKFQSHLPTSIIERFTLPGALVCDPFSGGGTTSVAAMLAGRNSFAMDLNPISVVISMAKLTKPSKVLFNRILTEMAELRPVTRASHLSKEELTLIGPTLSSFIESIWGVLDSTRLQPAKPLIAALLIKRIKLACRRDKEHLRTASFAKHVAYFIDEVEAFFGSHFRESSLQRESTSHNVVFGSNHRLPLSSASVDLIITSPPYPGIDIEYNLVQLQRRDLSRCFRSDVAQRISEDILGSDLSISKKMLCNGGSTASTYWENISDSLREMGRVLKPNAPCFIYIGFKEAADRKRFEKSLQLNGFNFFDRLRVVLGKERVASSRGLYHGRDTSMLKEDLLYILERL